MSKEDDAYKAGYARIFGNRTRAETGSWVWHPVTMELIPKSEYVRPDHLRAPMIMKGLEEFRSPIDGSMISDRSKLRAHNARHGVTNMADYGDRGGASYFEKKAAQRDAVLKGDTPQAKRERRDEINETLKRHGI